MIADTLSDAVNRMRFQLGEMPEHYAKHRERIETLIYEMDGLRRDLDTPPLQKPDDASGGRGRA